MIVSKEASKNEFSEEPFQASKDPAMIYLLQKQELYFQKHVLAVLFAFKWKFQKVFMVKFFRVLVF